MITQDKLPSSDRFVAWTLGYLRKAVAALKESLPPEPTVEPERAFWHLSWNSGVDAASMAAPEAYASEHGNDAPRGLLPLALRMGVAFHTNPYPGRMVIDVTGDHLAGKTA